MGHFPVFFFLAAASIALFSFLAVVHWIDTRAAERRGRDRWALLRKLADQPGESARLVGDLIREEDARAEQRERERAIQARRENLQAGAVLVAVGGALGIMLSVLAEKPGIWTVGLIPMAVGVVVFGFAFFSRTSDRPAA